MPNLAVHFLTQTQLTYHSLFSSQWSPSPPGFDFWKEAEKLGQKAMDYVDNNLTASALQFPSVADRIAEFKVSVQDLVKNAEALRPTQGALVARTNTNINYDEFFQRFSGKIDTILEDLKAEFSERLPEDRSERYKAREVAVDRALEKLENAFVEVYGHWHVPEAEAREKFSHVKPQIRRVVLLVGDLADRHPVLVEVLLVTAAIMIIPEGIILRPLLRVFGFGPGGVVKGSGAAWAQRFFFREAIAEGSWFASLQAAGMKWVAPGLGKKIGIPIAIGGGILGSIGVWCR